MPILQMSKLKLREVKDVSEVAWLGKTDFIACFHLFFFPI